jgi:hypothetical protein
VGKGKEERKIQRSLDRNIASEKRTFIFKLNGKEEQAKLFFPIDGCRVRQKHS